jgi:hypothetical protein
MQSGLRVHHGRGILFSCYVNFTGSPAAIAQLIQVKALLEVPVEVPDKPDAGAFMAREAMKVPWDWWQPSTLHNARFFFRHHQSEAVQGWNEGWWVSATTNEVYAFISG